MADACHHAGVGRRCDPTGLDAAIGEVMNDPKITDAAAAAAHQIAELSTASEVASLIELLTSGPTSD